MVIKEVNGIKIAILAYAYGFNGMETTLTPEEQADVLSDLDEERMKAEIQKAEQEADITIVMPQMGIRVPVGADRRAKRALSQDGFLGADIVFGGHPHVVEPAEVVNKDGQNKLIIYSMGNFLSNQRLETMEM